LRLCGERWWRILTVIVRRVLVILTALCVVAAVVVAATSGGSPPTAAPSPQQSASVQRSLQRSASRAGRRFRSAFGARPWQNQQPLRKLSRLRNATRLKKPFSTGGSCEIGSGGCSLNPCVDRIATAPVVPAYEIQPAPLRRRSARACRHPGAILARAS
jgi:hypothetical protein